ncbi:carotenoid isomerooxygenase-like [Ostrinia furnacalis]|uniref:carotenoid isomerooxygenase-like n=1 Tax=Ostrinia furnacalis TaxID=93504 RepID=UPI001039A12C|nr:carotenoid isomerooxygenase-like [Ostrinia furnacalis]
MVAMADNNSFFFNPLGSFEYCPPSVASDGLLWAQVIKVDTWTGATLTWSSADCYPSEPVFVPAPDAKSEDDGVLLSALVYGRDARRVALLVLCARSLRRRALAAFRTPSPAPKCLHGWFLPHAPQA